MCSNDYAPRPTANDAPSLHEPTAAAPICPVNWNDESVGLIPPAGYIGEKTNHLA